MPSSVCRAGRGGDLSNWQRQHGGGRFGMPGTSSASCNQGPQSGSCWGCKSHRLDHCRSELIHAATLRRREGQRGRETNELALLYSCCFQAGIFQPLLLPPSLSPSLSAELVLAAYLHRQRSLWPLAAAEQWHYARHKEYPGNGDRHSLIRSVPSGF